MEDVLKFEHIINEKDPQDIISKLFPNCYLPTDELREKEKSQVVKLDKVCQTNSIYIKDILLKLLTDMEV